MSSGWRKQIMGRGEGWLRAWRNGGSDSLLPRAGVVARWLCSASAKPSANAEAGGDPPLHRRLSALGRRGCASTVPDTLDQWVAEGNQVRKKQLVGCATRLRRLNKHHHALQVLEWLGTQGIVTSQTDQAVRLGLVAKVEGIASAECYFRTLDKNKHTSAALLSCYCQRKMVNEAVSLFQRMKHELGLPSHALPHKNMINLHWKLGQYKRVTELFEAMKEEGCASDGYPFALVMQSYAAVGDLHGAERVLEDGKRASAKKGVLHWRYFTTLAAIHVAAGNYDRASSILAELEQTIKRYNRDMLHSLVSLYANMGNSAEVYRLWRTLRSRFPKVTDVNYLTLLQALARLCDFEGLKKCYEDWQSSGCNYDERGMLILLRECLEREMINEAELLFDDSLARHPNIPSAKAVEMLIDFAAKKQMAGVAVKYLDAAFNLMRKDKDWRLSRKRMRAWLKCFEGEKTMDGGDELIRKLKKLGAHLEHTSSRLR